MENGGRKERKLRKKGEKTKGVRIFVSNKGVWRTKSNFRGI